MSKMIEGLKKLIYYRQHPDTALRYFPIVDLIKKNRWNKLKILEVGSGSYGIAPYLNRPIDGLDIDFDEPEYELINRINGSALDLPFGNNSYDLIILSDVLEHIFPDKRGKCLNESIRVARVAVVISGPFGKEAFNQDQQLAEYSLQSTRKVHKFLQEHLQYGLPEIEDVIHEIKKNKKVRLVRIMGKYLNLSVRKFLMRMFISKSKLLYYLYLKGIMPFVLILRHFNNSPCYRSLILIELKS